MIRPRRPRVPTALVWKDGTACAPAELFSAAFINPTEEWNMKELLLITTAIGRCSAPAHSRSHRVTSQRPSCPRGANPDQSTFVHVASSLVDLVSDFGTVCPERAGDLFR